ncbi:unnamed protein product [Prorocentrum cordatum]|uniref:Uncharacterized protein n=1 Tax=Prorocentrum cordatum TaxID=2364126 RepID=A0ABN9TP30_9DINO|nr:unnamed protein product [Polarella glacialis]
MPSGVWVRSSVGLGWVGSAAAPSPGALRAPRGAGVSPPTEEDISDLSFRFLDAAAAPAGTAGGRRDWLYGWGFSYAFTRSAWELAPFPDVEFAEDMGFVEGLIAHGVPVALARLPCAANGSGLPLGLVAHSCHPGSTSGGEDLASRGRCGVPAGMPHSLARLMPMVRRIQHMWPGLLHDFGPRSTVLGAPLGKRLATGVPRGPLAPRRPQAPRALALQRRR